MPVQGRFRSFDFWDGVIFGAVISTIICLIVAAFYSGLPSKAWGAFATLLAVPTAFFAAMIALWTTRYQLSRNRDQDLASARAVLPLALTRMIEVSREAILMVSGQRSSAPASLQETREILLIDDATIQALRDNVRAADPVTQEWLSVAIARYQVYFARVESWFSSPPPHRNRQGQTVLGWDRGSALLDWATFFALTEHFFSYARGGAASVPGRLDITRISAAIDLTIPAVTLSEDFTSILAGRLIRVEDGKIDHFQFKRD